MQCVWLIPVIILNKLYLENYLCSAAHITRQCQPMLLFNRSSSDKCDCNHCWNESCNTENCELYKWLGEQENIQRSRMLLLAIKLSCWSHLKKCLDVTVIQLLCIVEAICADLGSFHVLKGSGRTAVLFFFSFLPKTYLKCERNSLQEDEFCLIP